MGRASSSGWHLGDADGVLHKIKTKPVQSIWCFLHTQPVNVTTSLSALADSKLLRGHLWTREVHELPAVRHPENIPFWRCRFSF